jgi:Domain of unknown function (DUF4123)/Inner membrane component of T3SS, cytoplasmic domain
MKAALEVKAGPDAGAVVTLEAGKRLRVGRRAPAEWVLAKDYALSGLHFEVLWDGKSCRIRDLGSTNGTEIAGRRIETELLKEGQELCAGKSVFLFRIETAVSTASTSPAEIVRALERNQPLYAILDSARTPQVLQFLSSAKEQFQNLYDGLSAVKLATCAPYLVRLPERSRLLRKLVRHGWGQSWGVYLVCDAPFAEVRRHLRHFLMVNTEDGKQYYFRFYDPRVLGVFLKTCEPKQQHEFFGPVQAFYADSTVPMKVSAPVAK